MTTPTPTPELPKLATTLLRVCCSAVAPELQEPRHAPLQRLTARVRTTPNAVRPAVSSHMSHNVDAVASSEVKRVPGPLHGA